MYKLPNKHNDVVQDIKQLAETMLQVDQDIAQIDTKVQSLTSTVNNLSDNTVQVELEDREIHDIAANRFLTVNNEGNGFTCVEGGGASGGLEGQCNLKKSDASFDVAYSEIFDISKNGTVFKSNEEIGESGQCHVFSADTEINNDEALPKNNVINQQVNDDYSIDRNESIILKDEIEPFYETVNIATNVNYGFIKVGDGVTVADGVISAKEIKAAARNRFGMVQVGNGIEISDGTISAQEISQASRSNFGVVKLSQEFQISETGAMELADMADAEIIYKLSQSKSVLNGNVDLEEKTLIYRAVVTEDIVFSFNLDFEPKADISFVLEIMSDGTHLIHFKDTVQPISQDLTVNRGTTKLFVTKNAGVPFYSVVVSRLDCPEPQLLTPRDKLLINDNLRVTCPKGGSWIPYEIIRDYNDGCTNAPCVRFEFKTLVCVDYVRYITDNREYPMTEFSMKASADGKTWTTLIYRTNEIIEKDVYTDVKGCFRFFEINLGYTNDYNKPRGITLWGTQIDNNESEVTLLTPYMSSNIGTVATMTANNITSGSASDLTDTDCNTLLKMTKTGDDWIKYEFTEAKIANVLELHFRGTGEYYGFYGDRHPNWFTLEGSNDDETWTLLLERKYQGSYWAYDNNVVFFDFNNETAYKYYKFTCVATNSTSDQWGLSGFKLYQQSVGKHNVNRLVPKLSSASQDGYEVTVSSQCGSGHEGYLAFDDNTGTRWATAANAGDGWLQIKLPSAAVANVVQIAPRGDGYLDQAPSDFQIQGSNNGEDWDVLDSETDVSWETLGELRSFEFENETAYLYYRLYITKNQGSAYTGCSCFIPGKSSFDYKRILDKYDYLVPIMSSNSQDGYEITAESFYDNTYSPWKAFNRTNSSGTDCWACSNDSQTDGDQNCNTWLQIKLPTAISFNYLRIVARNGLTQQAPKNFTLKASHDGQTWVTLLTQTDQVYETKGWELSNTTKYTYYRLNITKTNGANTHVAIGQLDLMNHTQITEY